MTPNRLVDPAVSRPERKALLARCIACAHEWPLFYLPISLDEANKFSAKVPCPACRNQPANGHEVQAFMTAGWG